jgi:hypothetical protein
MLDNGSLKSKIISLYGNRLHSSPFISLLPYISMIFISVLMMTSRYVQGTAFVIPTMLRLKEFVSRMEHKGRDAAARGVCV